MRRIYPLPSFVANQIAAGEVIERPASVVKELLENAWDAGATEITLVLCAGGLNQIKITDNGQGIDEADLLLAIAPHATSKMQQLTDLYQLESMGFRGEALASIASISRLTLTSKPPYQAHAHSVRCDETGVHRSICARTQGTTVDVLDLFYNAPVRKRFLKSTALEYQAIEAIVRRFALSAMHIALTVWHDGKKKLYCPAAKDMTSKRLRIQKIVGKAFITQAIEIDATHEHLRLTGWISALTYQRSQPDQQWIYLNQRMVKDKILHRALKQAYEGLLDPGRYSACVLYYDMPKGDVDVNVHPTKHEVRFQQPRSVHDFFYATLRQVLSTPSAIPPPSVQRMKKEDVLRSTAPSSSLSNWIWLNEGFALLFLDDHLPYLVDTEYAARHYFEATITSWPLPSRPLLMTLEYPCCRAQWEKIEPLCPVLLQLGIQCVWRAEQLQVQTLPQGLPYLDLQSLWPRLNTTSYTPQTLLAVLLSDYVWHVNQWSFEKQMALDAYVSAHLKQGAFERLGCQRLDQARCREICHGTI